MRNAIRCTRKKRTAVAITLLGVALALALAARLGQPAVLKPRAGSKAGLQPIAFFAPTGQVSIASDDVQDILYSFDGRTWNHAQDLHRVLDGFDTSASTSARLALALAPREDNRRAAAQVMIRYADGAGHTSPAAHFRLDADALTTPSDAEAASRAAAAAPAPGALVYSNDFEAGPGSSFPEWSSSLIRFSNRFGLPLSGTKEPGPVRNVASPRGQCRFLGEFGGPRLDPTARTRVSQTIRLALKELVPHSRLTLSFDLLVLKSWDGSSPRYGPDRWSVRVVDGPILLDTTFSNNPKLGTDQSFQDYPVLHTRPQAGAAARRTLGYTFFGDSIYHFRFTFPHTAASLTLDFASDLFEGKGPRDESWGLDNVAVWIDGSPTASAPP